MAIALPSVEHFQAPPQALVNALLQRDGQWLYDEDGRDLTEFLWNFGSKVEMHTDEFGPGCVIAGYVLSGQFDLVVDGSPLLPLRPGDVYLLDPDVLHGVPDGSFGDIICYVRKLRPSELTLPLGFFVQEALAEAENCISDPPAEPGEHSGPVFWVESDGQTVWVNGPGGDCLGRFGWRGIDIHRSTEAQMAGEPQCAFCTHSETRLADWSAFQAKMKEVHGIWVGSQHLPDRLKQDFTRTYAARVEGEAA